jgi:O-antigen/teichoic acid export membrane protein
LSPPLRVRGNIVASALMAIWLPLLGIFTTRELVRGLGVEGYGLLVLVNSVAALMGLAQGGLGFGVIKHLSHDLAVGDHDSARAVVGTSLAMTTGAGVVALLVLSFFSTALIDSVLHVEGDLAVSAYTIVVLTSLTIAVGLVGGIYHSVLAALQRYGALAAARLATATLLAVVQVSFLRLGLGLISVAAASLIFGVLNLVLLIVYVAKSNRTLVFRPTFSRPALKKLLAFGTFRALDVSASLMLMQIDRVIVGVYLGAAGIAYYSIPQSLAQQFSHMATSLTEPLFPRLSEMLATGDRDGVRRLFCRGTRLLCWFIITSVVCAIVMCDALFRYWLGEEFAEQAAPVMRWLLVGWGLMALSLVSIFTLNAFGSPHVNAAARAVQGAVLVSACLMLVPRVGAIGAAYGLAGGMLLTVPVCLTYVNRKLNFRSAEVVTELYGKPIVIGAVLLAVGGVLHQLRLGLAYDVGLLALLVTLSLGLALGMGTISRDERALGLTLLSEAWAVARGIVRRAQSRFCIVRT